MTKTPTICGVLALNGELDYIFCDKDVGECFYKDPVTSYDYAILGLTVTEAVEYPGISMIEALLQSGNLAGAYGLIFTDAYAYALVENADGTTIAEKRAYDNLLSHGDTHAEVNMNGEFDAFEEYKLPEIASAWISENPTVDDVALLQTVLYRYLVQHGYSLSLATQLTYGNYATRSRVYDRSDYRQLLEQIHKTPEEVQAFIDTHTDLLPTQQGSGATVRRRIGIIG